MNDDPLVRYLANRSRRDFTECVRAHRDAVLNAAHRVLGDEDAAEDVAQEVFVKLLTAQWKPSEIRSPRGLLVNTAMLVARERLREESRRAERERSANIESRRRSERSLDHQVIVEIRDAIETLPTTLQACVELRYFGGLALSEVASALGWPLRTTNLRLREARDFLKLKLAGPAAALLVPLLDSDGAAALPTAGVSEELSRRLDEIARNGPMFARAAKGRPWSLTPVTIATAVVLLVVGGGVAWVSRVPQEALRESAPEGETAVAVRRTEPKQTESPPRQTQGERSDSGVAAPPAPAAQQATPPALPAGTGGFSIEVVDEDGRRLSQGSLDLEVDPLSTTFDELVTLAPLTPQEDSLRHRSLADGNPSRLTGLPPCGLIARANAPSWAPCEPYAFRVEVGRISEARLVLSRPRSVNVLVRDRESGQPLVGARVVSVTAHRTRGGRTEPLLEEAPSAATTDAEGRCRLSELGVGVHRIEASLSGYAPGRIEARVPLSDAEVALLEVLRLDRPASIRVVVRDPLGKPVPDVAVRLSVTGTSSDKQGVSDAQGAVLFTDLAGGEGAQLLVEARSWRKARERMTGEGPNLSLFATTTLKDGEETEMALGYLPGVASLDTLVVGPRGQPMCAMNLRLVGPCARTGQSEENGRVAFDHLPAGSWRLCADTAQLDWWWFVGDLDVGGRKTMRLVVGSATITGRVVAAKDASPLGGVAVVAMGPARALVQAAADGTFSLPLAPPGAYSIEALGPVSGRAAVTVVGNSDPPPVELRLAPLAH